MRKSLPRTLLSGLSSKPSLLGSLLGAGVSPSVRKPTAWSAPQQESTEEARLAVAKLALLESFLVHPDAADCARQAIDWLVEHVAIEQALCAAVDPEGKALVGLAGYRLPFDDVGAFSIDLEHRHHPLVGALLSGRPITYPASEANGKIVVGSTLWPRDGRSFHVLPIGSLRQEPQIAAGLLMVSMERHALPPELRWVARTLGEKLEQLRQQKGLREDQTRYSRERGLLYRLINSVSDPILLTDPEGRLIIANTRAETLFAAGEEESEGRRGAVRLNNMLLSSALSSTAIEVGQTRRELLLVDPSEGSDLLFELLSTVIQDPREGTGIVSILRNVSDLRRATEEIEENYRKMRVAETEARAERDRLNVIIDSVADPIVVTDVSGDISMMNAPAENLFTLSTTSDEAAQRSVQSNDAHFSSFISGLLFSSDRQRRGDVGLIDPFSGQPLPVEALSGKILSDHGELVAVVTILHDRREAIEKAQLYEQLKRASEDLEIRVQAATADIAEQNERLRRQAIELEQVSALKSQFLANMSHEFRTPLNAILGYTHMLLHAVSGELNPPQKKQLERIDSNSRHLLAIISEILDISRIESGRMPLQVSEFRLAPLMTEVTSELEPIIARSRLAVTTDLALDLPPLRSDRQKVKQIILNLLSNSLKFTPKGSVMITGHYDHPSRTVSIDVIDTGIGMPEGELEHIFEDFRQLDNSPTRAYGGTGLGLSICRRLAMMLGGTLTVRSTLGKGSTFSLRLPTRAKKQVGAQS